MMNKKNEGVSPSANRSGGDLPNTRDNTAAGRLQGLKQNLLAERNALEEKMQQLKRRLQAIDILLEE